MYANSGAAGYLQGTTTDINLVGASNKNVTFTSQGTGVQSFITGGASRMYIDTAGRVGIGCTPVAGVALDVANAGVMRIRSSGSEGGQIDFNNASDASVGLTIDVAGTDVARIFQANNNCNMQIGQLVGTGGQINLYTASTLRTTIDSGGLIGLGMLPASTVRLSVASSSAFIFVGRDSTGTTDQIRIASNGNVTNTNNSYAGISDVKLKENIVDATPKLADLMQVKVRNYHLKTDPEHKQLGVIAQELETVFPAMVETDPEGTKSVKYSVFVPMLVKAMQEQQALIESLTTRLTALEQK
jgi:hypothetical protein